MAFFHAKSNFKKPIKSLFGIFRNKITNPVKVMNSFTVLMFMFTKALL